MPRCGIWITHSCGHKVHHDYHARPSVEDIRRERQSPCPVCCQICVGQMSIPGTDTKPPEPETHLPDLQGSPAQVSWGEDIRKKQLAAVQRHLREWQRLIDACADPQRRARANQNRRAALDGLDRLEKIVSAHWWIEHREEEPHELLKAAREDAP